MKVARSRSPGHEADRRPAARLEEAFARFQGELLGTLYYLVGNREDARDALQEAFLKCWRHRESVDQVGNLKAWIFRIALNTGRDIRATAWRRKRTPVSDSQDWIAPTDHPEDAMAQREQLQQIRRAIAGLRVQEQEVFLLRQNAQMTYAEIADAVGIPLGTVKTRMRLALAKLREAVSTD